MEHDKVILQRFIENELHQPDFLNCKGHKHLEEETFLFGYVAGHGCADTHQIFVLNEMDVNKAFWNIEKELIRLAKRCGKSLKILFVYDICREPKATTMESMRKGKEAKGLPAIAQAVTPAIDQAKPESQPSPSQ